MADGTLFDLDEVMAWARGEVRLRVRLPNGASDEMSVAEVGEFFGWSKSKVKIRAWRARNSLKKTFRKYL